MKYIITERQLNFLTETEDSEYEVSLKSKVAYHITPDIFLNQIQQVGLVPKSESKISQHPERIYLFMAPDMDKQMTNILWDVTKKETRDKIKDYYVLQVDLTQLPNHRFYNDPATSFSYVAIFTLDPIPSSAIKVIKKIPVSDLKQGPSADEIKKEREDNEKWLAQYEKDKSAQDAQRKADQEKWDEISKMLANADPKKLKMSWEDFSNMK